MLRFKPKWTGTVVNYRKGAMTPIEHIMSRHGSASGYANVGRFSQGTRGRDIIRMVDDAATNGSWSWSSRGRATITYDFGSPIGTTQVGQSTSRITVHLNEAGEVMTAFPSL